MSVYTPVWAFLNALANNYAIPLGVALVIGVPSALLYGYQIWLILRNQHYFGSSFFRLVVVRSLVCLIGYLNGFIGNRFGRLGLFLGLYKGMPRLLLALIFFIVPYSLHVENLSTAFLLLNRLTAVICPTSYEKLWQKGLPIALAIIVVAPLPVTVPILAMDVYVHVQADNATFTLDVHKTVDLLNQPEIQAISCTAFIGVCLALNLASLFAYRCHRRKSQIQQKQADASIERKMTVYTVLTFFAQLIMALYQITIFAVCFQVDEQNNVYSLLTKWFSLTLQQDDVVFFAAFNQQAWINDLGTVALPAWLLLWASSKMREIIAGQFAWLKCIQIGPQQPTNLTNNKSRSTLSGAGITPLNNGLRTMPPVE